MTVQQQTAGEAEHARAVRAMFSGVASRYDLLNHVLSLNIDKRWRRLVRRSLADVLERSNALVLDVACGTGDLSIELQRHARARVVGCDFCRPMLAIAADKNSAESKAIPYVETDAMDLAFDDDTFDAVTISFGLRNLSNVEHGLVELRRVLKAGGRLTVLEFSSPMIPGFRQLFNFYFSHILPRIGGAISREPGAYEYLPDSVAKFPDQKALVKLIEEAGFDKVEFKNLTGGIAALHSGIKA